MKGIVNGRCLDCDCDATCRGTFAAWDDRDICQLWQCPRCNQSAVIYQRREAVS